MSPKTKVDSEMGESPAERPMVQILDDEQWHLIRKQFRMSPRELEIARMVCGGLTNESIASKLKIKSATVKTHLRNVYRRINVQRKLDMLLIFLSSRGIKNLPPKMPLQDASNMEIA